MTKVVIYSKDYCPYCKSAKNLLTQRNIPFDEVIIGENDESQFKQLCQRSGMRTVPQIFFGEKLIGGFMELAELDRKDNLKSLLRAS